MNQERMLTIGLAAGIAALLGYSILGQRDPNATRGGRPPRVPGVSAVQGASLDITPGFMTPEHLLWFGPSGPVPQHWQPHRVRYPLTPGSEINRLIYGAPMSCNTVTPASERPWLFDPPAEVDF